jgi:hypothetical protein
LGSYISPFRLWGANSLEGRNLPRVTPTLEELREEGPSSVMFPAEYSLRVVSERLGGHSEVRTTIEQFERPG